MLAADRSGGATTALGVALIAFALLNLSPLRLSVPKRAEPWLAPVIGVATGFVSAATGVYAIPLVPYLQALGLERDAPRRRRRFPSWSRAGTRVDPGAGRCA